MGTSGWVRIAVCGHRYISDIDRLELGIQTVVERIHTVFTEQQFQLLSCLAEGSDRLLASRLFQLLPADLTVVLPLPEIEYVKDFQTKQSILEFQDLKHMAVEVIEPQENYARPRAYHEANLCLIENCDLLVTIWDGKPARGTGGTAEVVEKARQKNLPLLWIHANQPFKIGCLTEERLVQN